MSCQSAACCAAADSPLANLSLLRAPPLPLQGVDCVHGCYGATAALFNAAAWVQSGDWDGRLAVVVGSDVAMYEPGTPAAATGETAP